MTIKGYFMDIMYLPGIRQTMYDPIRPTHIKAIFIEFNSLTIPYKSRDVRSKIAAFFI